MSPHPLDLLQHSGDSDDRIRLLLASEEISFLKGKLLAVSPSEWTGTELSPQTLLSFEEIFFGGGM